MQLLIACHCLWFEYYHCLLESNHLLTFGIAPATTSSRLAIMILLPILMLTLTRDPRGTLGDEGNKKKQQTNTFCSNLLQDVIEVPASFQRHSAPPQTNNLHYQDTPGWGSHSLKLRKAQQWKETTIHCPGGRASSATSAQVCQGDVREPGNQVKIPPPSQMHPWPIPGPLWR